MKLTRQPLYPLSYTGVGTASPDPIGASRLRKSRVLPLDDGRLAGDRGIEPQSTGPRPVVFPLDESPVAEGEGIEPPNRGAAYCFRDSFLDQPDTFRMAAGVGVEPTSPGSEPGVLPLDHPTVAQRAPIRSGRRRCASSNRSTSELPRNFLYGLPHIPFIDAKISSCMRHAPRLPNLWRKGRDSNPQPQWVS